MASPKACTNRKYCQGFTFIEVMMVMGLLVIIGSLGLFMSMESFRDGSFRNDRDMVVGALQRARSLAVNNMCLGLGCTDGQPHGVHFDPAKKEIVIFQGGDFIDGDFANEIIEFDGRATYICASSSIDMIFDRIGGNAATTTVILKDDAGHISTIETNSEGRIDWQ